MARRMTSIESGASAHAPPKALLDLVRRDVASHEQLQNAYLRFLWGRKKERRPARARWTLGIVLSALIVAGVASAAPGVTRRWLGIEPAWPPRAHVAAAASLRPARRAPQLALNPVPTPLASAEPSVNVVDPESLPVDSEHAAPPPIVKSNTEKAPVVAPAWERAASALRNGDLDRADAALEALESNGTAAEREAARFSRARVLLASGREAQAQQLLRSLAVDASSPKIRAKARALIER